MNVEYESKLTGKMKELRKLNIFTITCGLIFLLLFLLFLFVPCFHYIKTNESTSIYSVMKNVNNIYDRDFILAGGVERQRYYNNYTLIFFVIMGLGMLFSIVSVVMGCIHVMMGKKYCEKLYIKCQSMSHHAKERFYLPIYAFAMFIVSFLLLLFYHVISKSSLNVLELTNDPSGQAFLMLSYSWGIIIPLLVASVAGLVLAIFTKIGIEDLKDSFQVRD